MTRAFHHIAAALIGAAVFLGPAWADAPPLLFPVACDLGETCFLQQFVDRDPGPGWRDFTCGPASYDGHSGTDIRVADRAALAQGWSVLAAAAGTVRAIRDGVPDGGVATTPEGQECGNGVVIDHADGWQTQYCHLALGSVLVTTGQEVAAGTPLGEIGYSGRTEFPHLEFLIRHEGAVVDPFDPSAISTCGSGAAALWATPVPVAGGGLLSAGFTPGVPEFEDIRAGTASAARISPDQPLVLWVFVHGGREGDAIVFVIEDRDGQTIHQDRTGITRSQAELFRASGRRAPPGGWAAGDYRGELRLLRGSRVLDRLETTIVIEAP